MAEIKKRISQIEFRMWNIEMADYIRGDERREYEELRREKAELEAQLKNFWKNFQKPIDKLVKVWYNIYRKKGRDTPEKERKIKMMNINEYWRNKMVNTNTEAEFDAVCDEEQALYEAWQNDEIDLEAWAAEHGVDLEAIEPRTGVSELTHWAWDMEND